MHNVELGGYKRHVPPEAGGARPSTTSSGGGGGGKGVAPASRDHPQVTVVMLAARAG